ncbi:MAG: hypothetical protein U0168_15110 [Nannocystaceae bacterium]
MTRRCAPWLSLLLAGASACEKPPEPTEAAAPPAEPKLIAPVCSEVPSPPGVVAQWSAPDGCPMWLALQGERMQLSSSSLVPTPTAAGERASCRVAPCEFEGVMTPLGPMVVVTEPGAQSEVPVGVQLGFVVGLDTLVFVDLWAGAGAAVVEDSTALGPGHALVPSQCGTKLGLLARPRLPAAQGQEVPRELLARQGTIELSRKPLTIVPGPASGCVPLSLPLP